MLFSGPVPGLHARGQFFFLIRRQKFNLADLLQIHAHRVVHDHGVIKGLCLLIAVALTHFAFNFILVDHLNARAFEHDDDVFQTLLVPFNALQVIEDILLLEFVVIVFSVMDQRVNDGQIDVDVADAL